VITAEMRGEMRRLVLVEAWKVETVARRFQVHHSVVRRAIRTDAAPGTPAPPPPSKLEPFKPYVVERVTALPELTGTRLFRELQERGYTGGVAVLRRYLARLRPARSRKEYLRIEVEMAEQAQVDWGSFGHIRIGDTQRPLSCFAMVLSWSRALFIDFTLDQRMDTFLRCHERAFRYFGGMPRRVLYDNLKSVVLHHIGATVQFNPRFLQYAGHQLFEPRAAPVRYPEAKGRVENAIKYIRQSFFYGRSFSSLADLRAQAARWCDEVANLRLHATTRQRPAERLLQERTRLLPLPEHPFDTDLVLPVVIGKEACVVLDTNRYSVPPGHVGQSATLRADDTQVRVFGPDGALLARHERSWARRRRIDDPTHAAAMLEHRPGARASRRRDRISGLSDEAKLYLQHIARRPVSLDNEVEKLVRLLDRYGEADFRHGVAQALAQGAFGARFVRALIDQERFRRGLPEAPEPIVTGNRKADELTVTPHDLAGYDELF
jgi:transposase